MIFIYLFTSVVGHITDIIYKLYLNPNTIAMEFAKKFLNRHLKIKKVGSYSKLISALEDMT